MLKPRTRLNGEKLYHQYLDLEVTNPTTLGARPVPLNFTEIRNSSIISSAGEYFVSIVRLNMDTWYLPLYIPSIQIGQSNVNQTNYWVTLQVGATYFTQNVVWTTENPDALIPPAPVTQQHILDDYYYGNSYQHLIGLINTALRACAGSVGAVAALTAAFSAPAAGEIPFPFMQYSESQVVGNMYGLQKYYDQGVTDIAGTAIVTNPAKIYFNTALYAAFNSLPAKFNPVKDPAANALYSDYELSFVSGFGINIETALQLSLPATPGAPPVPAAGTYVACLQQFPTLRNLNPVSTIGFTSTLLPINATLISKPKLYGGLSANAATGSNANDNISNLLTDIVPQRVYGYESKNVNYAPQAEYRLIDLIGMNQSINQIDIAALWIDVYGGQHQILLMPGSSATIKLLFRRKDFEGYDVKLQ
jgi:hypothetical protein